MIFSKRFGAIALSVAAMLGAAPAEASWWSELTGAGNHASQASQIAAKKKPRPEAEAVPVPEPTPEIAAKPSQVATVVPFDDDDEEKIELVWYVLKVQSSREDTIRDALERRVKIQGLQRYFGRIVVPTEKTTEIRNNKKRIVERKTYPGYIMVEMELNEKTWFVVRETPGVGDFVGAHGTRPR